MLCPRPFQRQVSSTHDPLTYVVEAVQDMLLLRLEKELVDTLRVCRVHCKLGQEERFSDIHQTVQLVEERDIVDLALRGLDSGL